LLSNCWRCDEKEADGNTREVFEEHNSGTPIQLKSGYSGMDTSILGRAGGAGGRDFD